MLHHISIGVSNLNLSGQFYDEVLTPLRYGRVWEDIRPGERNQAIGYGLPGGGDKFTLKQREQTRLHPGPGFHLAFQAHSELEVEGFYKGGVAQGGISRGAPKIWNDFGSDYFAAYLIDLDGWQIEAVYKTSS